MIRLLEPLVFVTLAAGLHVGVWAIAPARQGQDQAGADGDPVLTLTAAGAAQTDLVRQWTAPPPVAEAVAALPLPRASEAPQAPRTDARAPTVTLPPALNAPTLAALPDLPQPPPPALRNLPDAPQQGPLPDTADPAVVLPNAPQARPAAARPAEPQPPGPAHMPAPPHPSARPPETSGTAPAPLQPLAQDIVRATPPDTPPQPPRTPQPAAPEEPAPRDVLPRADTASAQPPAAPRPAVRATSRSAPAGAAQPGAPLAGTDTARTRAAQAEWGASIQSRVHRNLRYPRGASGSATARVALTVDRAGRLTGVALKQSSGNPVFDKAALDAVRRSGRFARAPRELTRASYAFTLSLNFRP